MESRLSNNPLEDIAPIFGGEIDYGYTIAQLVDTGEAYADIKEISDRASFDRAQAALTALVRTRTEIEKRRKALKAESLEYGRRVDAGAKELFEAIEPYEDRLRALVDKSKAERAAKKAAREAAEKERVDGILEKIDEFFTVPKRLARASSEDVQAFIDTVKDREIGEDEYAEFVERAETAKSDTLAELDELLEGAIHDERVAAREKQEREEREAEQKKEAERLEKERAALEEQRKKDEAERRAEEARIAQARADEEARIAEERAELEAERERLDAEKRAEAERQAEQERQEAERIAAEEREARRIRTLPDREKILEYAKAVAAVEAPVLVSEEGNAAWLKTVDAADAFARKIKAIAETLG